MIPDCHCEHPGLDCTASMHEYPGSDHYRQTLHRAITSEVLVMCQQYTGLRCSPSVVSMLGQRLRRRPSIETTLGITLFRLIKRPSLNGPFCSSAALDTALRSLRL